MAVSIVCWPSEVMADKLIHLGVKNVFVQPLGVDLDTFCPSVATRRCAGS